MLYSWLRTLLQRTL